MTLFEAWRDLIAREEEFSPSLGGNIQCLSVPRNSAMPNMAMRSIETSSEKTNGNSVFQFWENVSGLKWARR